MESKVSSSGVTEPARQSAVAGADAAAEVRRAEGDSFIPELIDSTADAQAAAARREERIKNVVDQFRSNPRFLTSSSQSTS